MTPPAVTDKPARSPKKRTPKTAAPPAPDAFDAGRAETQSDFIVVFARDGTILYVNPAMAGALGYAAGAMAGTPLLPYIAGDFRGTMTANMAALEEMGEPPFFETVLVARDGLKRSVIVKGRPVLYNNSPASLLFLIDITEKQVLEDMLRARADELLQVSAALRDRDTGPGLSPATRRAVEDQLAVLASCLGALEPGQSDPALAGYCRQAMDAADRIAALIAAPRE
jgi:PAS domain S-box-containing protein